MYVQLGFQKIGLSGKSLFSLCNVVCVTNFLIVLVVCFVHKVIFIKKICLNKFQDTFLLIVKDTHDEKFKHVEKIMHFFLHKQLPNGQFKKNPTTSR